MSCDIAAHDGCESKQVSNTCAHLLGKREGKNPASFKDLCALRAVLMRLGHPAPLSLLPHELLQLQGAWHRCSNAQDQLQGRDGRLHRLMEPCGHRVLPHSCLLTGLEVQPVHSCLVVQCPCSSTASTPRCCPPQPVSSAPSLAPLPPGDLPGSPCFPHASLKPSNPTKYRKVFPFPPPKQGERCATDISTADKVVCPTGTAGMEDGDIHGLSPLVDANADRSGTEMEQGGGTESWVCAAQSSSI